MPSNLSIARVGSKPFLDATADQHNGKDHAWLISELEKLDKKPPETTRKDICKAMDITGPTFDKYRFVINLEKAQHDHQ